MTASSENRVASGYEILQIYALEQHYEVVTDIPEAEGSAADTDQPEPPMGINWDWRVLSGRDFEVQFGIEMPPTAELHEMIRVRFVLRARAGENTTVRPGEFVGAAAISVLIPYVREAITSMSARGPLGVRYLNPLNARVLADRFSFHASTGAKQLAADAELAALYGPPAEAEAEERA